MTEVREFTSRMAGGGSKPLILVEKYAAGNNLVFDKRIRPAYGILRARVTAPSTDTKLVELDMYNGSGTSTTGIFSQTVTFVSGGNSINLPIGSWHDGYWFKSIHLINIGSDKTVDSLYAQIWCYEVEE